MNKPLMSGHLQMTSILYSTHSLLVRFTRRLLVEGPAFERLFLQLAHLHDKSSGRTL